MTVSKDSSDQIVVQIAIIKVKSSIVPNDFENFSVDPFCEVSTLKAPLLRRIYPFFLTIASFLDMYYISHRWCQSCHINVFVSKYFERYAANVASKRTTS